MLMNNENALRDEMLRLATTGERGEPYVFVGRERERHKLLAMSDNMTRKPRAGATCLVSGPPGCGKSALAKEAAKRIAAHQSKKDSVLVIGLEDDGFLVEFNQESLSSAIGRMAEHLLGTSGMECRSVHELELRAKDKGLIEGRSVVLLIDEVQGIKEGASAAGMLKRLQLQDTLPILPICVGLQGSRIALHDAGFPLRLCLDGDMRLDCLAEDECISYVNVVVDAELASRGVPLGNAVDKLAERIARESGGWPTHLHNYAIGMFEALGGQDSPDLGALGVDAAVAGGNDKRNRYCRDVVAMSRIPVEVLDAVQGAIAPGMDRHDGADLLHDAVGRHVKAKPRFEREWERQWDSDAGLCFDWLINVGAVSLNRDDELTCMVPGLRSHIEGRAEMRQDVGRLGGTAPKP